MRLNVGCGARRLEGYTGVDITDRAAADIVAPAHVIPLVDGCADEILAIHLFEHFYRWECDTVIAEWRRLLRPGGLLVLELPDLLKTAQNIVDGRKAAKHPDQLTMWSLYGDPREEDPFMAHRWAWTPAAMTDFLQDAGFADIQQRPTQWHPVGREHRDMRIEARRT